MLPPVKVRQTLEAARSASVEFGAAWPAAREGVDDERWLEALAQTAAAWKRAYTLAPVGQREAAIDLVSRSLAGEFANLDVAAHCPACDRLVEQHRRARSPKIYCSNKCLKVAASRHEVLDVAA